jgi:hypothetical protein
MEYSFVKSTKSGMGAITGKLTAIGLTNCYILLKSLLTL